MEGKSHMDSKDVEMEGQNSAVPEEDSQLGDGEDQVMEPVEPARGEDIEGLYRALIAHDLTPRSVEEAVQAMIGAIVHFGTKMPSTSPSKPHLRPRDVAPNYQENRPGLPKKRKARSGSRSGSNCNDDEDSHLFAATLAETLRANPNREPETLKEFVSFVLF
jgi:hypothetical protein